MDESRLLPRKKKVGGTRSPRAPRQSRLARDPRRRGHQGGGKARVRGRRRRHQRARQKCHVVKALGVAVLVLGTGQRLAFVLETRRLHRLLGGVQGQHPPGQQLQHKAEQQQQGYIKSAGRTRCKDELKTIEEFIIKIKLDK